MHQQIIKFKMSVNKNFEINVLNENAAYFAKAGLDKILTNNSHHLSRDFLDVVRYICSWCTKQSDQEFRSLILGSELDSFSVVLKILNYRLYKKF